MQLTANAVTFEVVVQAEAPEAATRCVGVSANVIAVAGCVERQFTNWKEIERDVHVSVRPLRWYSLLTTQPALRIITQTANAELSIALSIGVITRAIYVTSRVCWI